MGGVVSDKRSKPAGARVALLWPSRLPRRVQAELVDQLYAFMPGLGLTSSAMILLVGGLMAARVADPGLAVLAVAASALVLGLAPLKRARRRAGSAASDHPRRWVRRYALLSWGYAALLGAMATRGVASSDDPVVELVLAAFGVAAGATALRNYFWPRILFGQLLLMVGVPALSLAATGQPLLAALGLALAVFASHMATIGVGLFRQAVASLEKDRVLETHEERYRLAARATRDLVYDWDLGTDRVTRSGDGPIFGYPYGQLPGAGEGWKDDIHPDDRARVTASLEAALKTGAEVWTAQYRYRRPDGSYAHALDRGFIVRDADGTPRRLVGAASDVTERLEMIEALRESGAHYRYRIESDPHPVWTADAGGLVIEMSPRWSELTGRPTDMSHGMRWMDIVHPDDRPGLVKEFTRVLRKSLSLDTRVRCRMAGGDYHWTRIRAHPRRGPDGRVMRWYGSSEDIHAQTIAEAALRESQARFATIFRQAMVGIGLSQPGRGFVMVNEPLAAILGRTPAQCVGLSVNDVTHPDDLIWNGPLFARHVGTGVPFDIEKRYLRPDGSFVWCRVRVSFVREGDATTLAVVIVQDLTEQKAAEAHLQELQSEVIHMSRATAMGAMGAAIAHELNQPLAAVANYSAALQMLLARPELDTESLTRLSGQLNDEALRAGSIVRRLRRLVAKGESEVGPEDLGGLIEEANTLALLGAADAGIECEVEHAAPLTVTADRVQVQQVLVNLVRNAIEAMRGAPRRRLRIETAPVDGAARIAIEDSGPGLSPYVRPHLFSPFVTTKDGGMGIGLSICRTIIEAHGGRIWAEDSDHGGARFVFTLPLAEGAPLRRRRARAAAA